MIKYTPDLISLFQEGEFYDRAGLSEKARVLKGAAIVKAIEDV